MAQLTDEERAELQRLRTEVATLRTRAEAEEDGVAPGGRGPARQRWRTVVATVLIVIGCVLAPLSVVAIWSSNQVTNTDRYVATISPLADEPAIQDAIADKITAQVSPTSMSRRSRRRRWKRSGTRGCPRSWRPNCRR